MARRVVNNYLELASAINEMPTGGDIVINYPFIWGLGADSITFGNGDPEDNRQYYLILQNRSITSFREIKVSGWRIYIEDGTFSGDDFKITVTDQGFVSLNNAHIVLNGDNKVSVAGSSEIYVDSSSSISGNSNTPIVNIHSGRLDVTGGSLSNESGMCADCENGSISITGGAYLSAKGNILQADLQYNDVWIEAVEFKGKLDPKYVAEGWHIEYTKDGGSVVEGDPPPGPEPKPEPQIGDSIVLIEPVRMHVAPTLSSAFNNYIGVCKIVGEVSEFKCVEYKLPGNGIVTRMYALSSDIK